MLQTIEYVGSVYACSSYLIMTFVYVIGWVVYKMTLEEASEYEREEVQKRKFWDLLGTIVVFFTAPVSLPTATGYYLWRAMRGQY